MARDRTARMRIREHLARHGTVSEPTGRATAELMEAIGYQGTPVAFIQLVAAMDKDGEIVREIRGKRTYAIGLPASVTGAPTSWAPSGVPAPPGGEGAVDYDQLAKALLREVFSLLADEGAGSSAEVARLRTERDEYLRRLEVAQRQLAALVTATPTATNGWDDLVGARGRALLAELTGGAPAADEQAV